MVHLTRRRFLAGAAVGAAALSLTSYATAYETGSALTLANYAPRLPNWPEDLELTIAVIADIHACYPWMSEERVGDIVDLANAQKPDLTVLLGDYVCTHRLVSGYVPPGAWAEQLARLEAPLGVYAILGNHDWWSAAIPTEPADNSRSVRRALAEAGVPLLENQLVRLSQRGPPFWLIGLGDLLALSLILAAATEPMIFQRRCARSTTTPRRSCSFTSLTFSRGFRTGSRSRLRATC